MEQSSCCSAGSLVPSAGYQSVPGPRQSHLAVTLHSALTACLESYARGAIVPQMFWQTPQAQGCVRKMEGKDYKNKRWSKSQWLSGYNKAGAYMSPQES